MSDMFLTITNDMNFLSHNGVPGMSWRTHKFGKWQKQAVYANGQDDPHPKKLTRAEKKEAKKAINDAYNDYLHARRRAKSGLTELNKADNRRVGTLLAGLFGGAVVQGLSAPLKSYNDPMVDQMTIFNTILGGAIARQAHVSTMQNKRADGYKTRHRGNDKDRYKLSTASTVRNNLSQNYIDAYSSAMDDLLMTYGR